jgi:hypothetical protein
MNKNNFTIVISFYIVRTIVVQLSGARVEDQGCYLGSFSYCANVSKLVE